MTFKARTTFAFLSLLIATSATPLNAWWLSDWLFNKPSAPTEVKTQTAATHLIAITTAALLLPISLLGWKLYSVTKKNTELEAKKTEAESKNAELEAAKQRAETTLSEKKAALDKVEKENLTLKTTNATLSQFKTDAEHDDKLTDIADGFRRKKHAVKQLALNANMSKYINGLIDKADEYNANRLMRPMLKRWKQAKTNSLASKAVHKVAAQRRAEHLAKSPLAQAEEARRQKRIASITGQNHQYLYPNGTAAQPLPGSLAHRRPGINSGQHQQPNANTLTRAEMVAAALGQI